MDFFHCFLVCLPSIEILDLFYHVLLLLTLSFDLLQRRNSAAKPRYDQSTFWGRLQHFMKVTDPRTLLINDAQLKESQNMVAEYQRTKSLPPGGAEALWAAQYSTSSNLCDSR